MRGPSAGSAVGATRTGSVVVSMSLILILVLVPGGRAAGRSTAPGSELDQRIQILGVDETGSDVVIDVAVPAAIGPPVAIAENFAVTDGGRLVDVDVAPLGTAADIVLVIDTSGSMRGSAIDAAKAAAAGFVEAIPDDARVGLISFGDTVVTDRSPSFDRAGMLSELAGLEATGEETVLWDALLVAADTVAEAGGGRSSVVVLSDGDDTFSSAGPADVAARYGPGRAILYAVAIESPDTDLVALEETVALVEGQFLATTDIAELETLYADIAGRLANRYRLRFPPAKRGRRTVVVSAAADGGGVATARTTIGRGVAGPTVGAGQPAADPPPVLNTSDRPTLGVVVTPAPGRLASPVLFKLGLGSMFAAIALAGVIAARPQSKVRLNAAAGADRLVGWNARLGQAADRMVSRHDRSGRIDRRLEAADIDARPGEFMLAWLLITVVAALGVAALFGPAAGTLTVVVAAVGAHLLLGIRASRHRSRFADQLTETLGIMAGSLRAGQSLPRSIELVAVEAPSPTAEQFNRIAFETRVGRDLTESIRDTADRMASPDLEWLAQAVDINRVMGGDLTQILDNVAATIRERRTVARQVDALSAEGRATGWLLLAMPVVLFLFSWWRTPDSIEALVTESLGRVLLAVAVTGMVVGHLWIRRLVRVGY